MRNRRFVACLRHTLFIDDAFPCAVLDQWLNSWTTVGEGASVTQYALKYPPVLVVLAGTALAAGAAGKLAAASAPKVHKSAMAARLAAQREAKKAAKQQAVVQTPAEST